MQAHEVLNAVDGSKLSMVERFVLVQMAQLSGPNPTCYAKHETIARRVGCSVVTASKAIASLVLRRILILERPHRQHNSDVYAFDLTKIERGTPYTGLRGKGPRKRKGPVDKLWTEDQEIRYVRDEGSGDC